MSSDFSNPIALYGRGSSLNQADPLLVLSGRTFLAPLAGGSDYSYRTLCREQGAALVCTELVSARGIRYSGLEASLRYLWIGEEERPVGIQLFGSDPEDFAFAIDAILSTDQIPRPDVLDLNMGCPVAKVVKTGAGSALMRTPQLAASIVERCVRSLEGTGIPVSCKFRRGFGKDENTAASFARVLVRSGASMLAIHGRTRDQMYSGQADWNCIAETAQAIRDEVEHLGLPPVLVVGNGDVTSADSAVRMLQETGVDAVMVGRAALGNPWIFREIDQVLRGCTKPFPPTRSDKIEAIRRQLQLALVFREEIPAVRELRKVLGWYLKGEHGAAALRNQAVTVSTLQEVETFLELWQREPCEEI